MKSRKKSSPKSAYKTEQEAFWSGEFGDSYSGRNLGAGWVAANTALFARVIARTQGLGSLIEFGANIGLNLRALRSLLPQAELAAIEINAGAAQKLRDWGEVAQVHEGSLLEFRSRRQWDLALIKGVLIHVNPEALPKAYEALYKASRRYICVVEYYNSSPVAIPYRGHQDRLFKRDFAGELMDRYPDLKLLDYGFTYHRDPNFPQDDTTWFLLEKR